MVFSISQNSTVQTVNVFKVNVELTKFVLDGLHFVWAADDSCHRLPMVGIINLFFSLSSTFRQNKLECLQMVRIFRLVELVKLGLNCDIF